MPIFLLSIIIWQMRCTNEFEKSFDRFKFYDYADYNDIL